MDALARYVQEAAALPFVWGERDCATWACDWVRHRTGIDPSGPIRGKWHDEASCVAFLEANGGLLAVASDMASRARLKRVPEPRRGDVGVIGAPVLEGGKLLAAIAICLGSHAATKTAWAWKCDRGLLCIPAACAAAWEVGV